MSEARHSPGPWKIGFGAGDQDEYFTVVDADGEAVTDYSVSNHDVAMSHTQMVANAKLIAAAPDLLAAAMLAHERVMRNGVLVARNIEELLDAIKKAIGLEKLPTRKATGGT